MSQLHRITYCSVPSGNASVAAVRALVGVAQMLNRRRDLTGVLAFTGNHYLQVLEGEATALARTMNSITRDPRHGDIRMLASESITRRQHGNWSMALLHSPDLAEVVAQLHAEPQGSSAAVHPLLLQLMKRLQAQAEDGGSLFATASPAFTG